MDVWRGGDGVGQDRDELVLDDRYLHRESDRHQRPRSLSNVSPVCIGWRFDGTDRPIRDLADYACHRPDRILQRRRLARRDWALDYPVVLGLRRRHGFERSRLDVTRLRHVWYVCRRADG